MLEAIGFDNYRIFDKETMLNLKPITILTGPNSSGKSSVIKAAKLLKQNTTNEKYSGPPTELNFMLDNYGHYLSEYDRIKNYFNKQKRKNISFVIPINLVTLGPNYFCDLKYGPLNDNSITLLSITLFSFHNGEKNELYKLSGELGQFYEISIDFSQFQSCLEKSFIPYIKEINTRSNDPKQNWIKYRQRASLPGLHLLRPLLKSIDKYDFNKPILPFYNFITDSLSIDSDSFDVDGVYNSLLNDIYNVKEYYVAQIKELNSKGTDKISVNSFFKKLEDKLFEFIKKNRLLFPLELDANEKSIEFRWEGLLYRDIIDEDIQTSERTQKMLFDFDAYFASLMIIYDLPLNKGIDDEIFTNTNIFYDYIKYVIIESMEQCRSEIIKSDFFDTNRVEQVLFYHFNNSRIGYNLINDFIKSSNKNKVDKISHFLKLFKIADSFEIKALDYGIYAINLRNGKSERPLSEYGYGISKIFFLLIAINTYNNLFIEEPESNLHPDLQSKIADIIVSSLKDGSKQFIIETHSEYFIRKLQYLVATKEIDEDKILINYFNPAESRKKEGIVKEIKIRKDGSLSQGFGPGFFDEADNLAIQLYISNKNTLN